MLGKRYSVLAFRDPSAVYEAIMLLSLHGTDGLEQRIYISDRTHSTPPAASKDVPTQPLPALSVV